MWVEKEPEPYRYFVKSYKMTLQNTKADSNISSQNFPLSNSILPEDFPGNIPGEVFG